MRHSPDSGASVESYGEVNIPCTRAISNEAVKTSPLTNESGITLFHPVGRRRVYRPRGQRFADACVDERDRFWGDGKALRKE